MFDSSKEERDLYLEKLAIKRKSNLNSIKEIFIPKEHFVSLIVNAIYLFCSVLVFNSMRMQSKKRVLVVKRKNNCTIH